MWCENDVFKRKKLQRNQSGLLPERNIHLLLTTVTFLGKVTSIGQGSGRKAAKHHSV